MIRIEKIKSLCAYTLFFSLLVSSLQAQVADSTTISLSLEEAMCYARESNLLIGVLKTEEMATQLDLADAKSGSLPRVLSQTSYQRYSKITLYDGLLGDPRKITKPPNSNAGTLNLETSFNLYSGNRQRSIVKDFNLKAELASINTKEQEAAIGLQVAIQYLDMIRFYFQDQLIKDQLTRARTRLKNINAFYTNGKVTRSDLLRVEVLLSNLLLTEAANNNDYRISNQKLNTLLNLDEFTKLIPVDTVSLHLPEYREFEKLLKNYSGTYSILKAGKNMELQENRAKIVKSFNLPSVSLFGGYGFSYPNTLIFPPVAQTFAVGLAGIRLTYDISSLYQNKNKLRAARVRITAMQQQRDWIEVNVEQETRALAIKYHETLERMLVIRKSIEQAEVNYKIQNNKYANQLSLLTDLLEADNLYQESRVNYIQANIAALSIYYRLLFLTGNL